MALTNRELRDHLLAEHGLSYPNVGDRKVASIHFDIHVTGRLMRPHTHPEMTRELDDA